MASDDAAKHLRRLEHRQRRALARYLRDEVHPFSASYRQPLEAADLHRGKLASLDDLRRLAPTSVDEVDPGAIVLRPTESQILNRGSWRLRWAAVVSKVMNKPAQVNRMVVEPAYKPIHWQLHDRTPVGYSSEDLERLGEAGRRWLELAGVRPSDVIVSVLPEGPSLAFWELQLGSRKAGIALAAVPPGTDLGLVAGLGPTVLAGEPDDLLELLRSAAPSSPASVDTGALAGVTTVLVAGALLDEASRAEMESLRPGAAVVNAWAPPGVRALWSECRNGVGLHVDPEREVVEVLDGDRPADGGRPGEVVWTGIGWRGSVLLRLRTGVIATLDADECDACGRMLPRLWPERPTAGATAAPDDGADEADEVDDLAHPDLDALDDHPEVVAWYVDERASGMGVRAVVALKDRRSRSRVLRELAEDAPDLDVVVAARADVEAHLEANGDGAAHGNGDRPPR